LVQAAGATPGFPRCIRRPLEKLECRSSAPPSEKNRFGSGYPPLVQACVGGTRALKQALGRSTRARILNELTRVPRRGRRHNQ
jgi:hypothetical protein